MLKKKKKLIMLRSSAVVIYERNPADIFVLLFHEKTCVKEATNKQTKKKEKTQQTHASRMCIVKS